MADITMCESATKCPLKKSCYRYTSIKSRYWQSYFLNAPYNKESKTCSHYVPMHKIKEDYV